MRPLSALSLVTGDGVGILHLQGVVVTVGLEFRDAVCLDGDVGVVFHHGVEELFLLFTGESRCLGGKGIEENSGSELVVVVVGEGHRDFGKTEAIEFVGVSHPLHHDPIAVGDKVDASRLLTPDSRLLTPEIIVLHDHQEVTTAEFILTVEDGVADALVVDIRPFVATGDDHRLVHTHTTVTGSERFDEFIARNNLDIRETTDTDSREYGGAGVRGREITTCLKTILVPPYPRTSVPSNTSGVPKDAGGLALTEHLIEITLIDRHTIATEHIGHQRRTLLLSDGWELGLVANQQHTTVLAAINELHKIIKQATATKCRIAKAQVRDHRGLIYNK